MANQPHDKDKRRPDQQGQQRTSEQQQRQDRDVDKPGQGGQGGQSDTNRVYGDRHPTSRPHTHED
jgi:hypothetical protein